jgi:hypothetical protein
MASGSWVSPSASRVAVRYGLPPGRVEDTLLDFEARGWVRNLPPTATRRR